MNKITITTWYEIEMADGESRKLKAISEFAYNTPTPHPVMFDDHLAKMGAIERKLLKNHE